MSHQAWPNGTHKDVAVHDECYPSGRDYSLNLLVLVFVSGTISLSQVDVTVNVLDLGVVDIYWCVVFRHHLCLRRFVHLQTLIFTFTSKFL